MAGFRPHFDARPAALGAALAVLAVTALPVQAQQVITDNSSLYSNNPNVYVDLGVLDQLGQPASLQSLLSGKQALEASGYPQLSSSTEKLKLKAPAQPKPKVAKAKPLATTLAEPPKPSGAEPAAATAAPQTAVETAPAAPLPPAPPAPPKVAESGAPTPIVKAPEPPKASALPPAPPAIESKQLPPPATVAAPPSPPEIKKPMEMAALPDASAPSIMEGGETLMQIVFQEGATRVPDGKMADLKSLAARMAKDEEMRLQLLAFAEGTDANASKARRLSLSRALAVRSYLIDQGVRSTRIDVRALGNKAGSGPSERVDVVMLRK